MHPKRHRVRKGRPRRPAPKALPDNLYDYADEPPVLNRPRDHHARAGDEPLHVVDDWPEDVPVPGFGSPPPSPSRRCYRPKTVTCCGSSP